ncbi:MAG: RNA-binding protein [Acidimicrobiales bacterium]|nr:RNA-binding protein [Hyphomonadaceae bacterium]RZV45088.1 MAG: RNA-binding protein [Acidimicrobiales bacterium]
MIAETKNEAQIEQEKGSHGHKPRERRDIASGQALESWQMIRIAFGPDGQVVPDFSCKLPGRGAWVASDRASVEKALKIKAFARAAKMNISVPTNLADQIEAGLAQRVLGLLGMAKRAGEIETGFDKVRGAAQGGLLAYRFEASDGSEDGRSKIRVNAKAVAKEFDEIPAPVVGCFSGEELGAVFGREHLVHVGVRKGRVFVALQKELTRLAGFRDLIPANWTDKEHESPFIPYESAGGK